MLFGLNADRAAFGSDAAVEHSDSFADQVGIVGLVVMLSPVSGEYIGGGD